MIRVQELRKSYASTVAVAGVSFEVRPGETFGLLGPNGAGKSTTISMMMGVLVPDGGAIEVGDGGAPSDPKSRAIIGLAPQSLAIYEELSAIENLTFFAKLYQLRGDRLRDRVAWAIEFAGLEERCHKPAKTYSGGMKRRLNMAIALVHDPQVIFFDEPTVGVDPQSRNHIFERIEQLKAAGRTMVYTTHYMEEAQRLCDRVAIMDHGRILDLDGVDALIDRHGGRCVVTAELLQRPSDAVELPAPLDGHHLRFESDQPLADVGRLSSAGIAFRTLEVTRPNLEQVFLTLTGRSLRD